VKKMTGGEALVRALADHGVDTVFGIPGTHNLEIYAHLDGAGIRHVSPRHEQGAGYAADGYARSTGRVGVAVVTSGPATLNAATAIGQAYSDSVPVLLISPGMPLRHPGRGNGLLHETKDQRAAMDAVAAYSHRVTSVAEVPVAVAQAFATMTSGRPRPVHLELPLDVLAETDEVAPVAPVVPGLLIPGLAGLSTAAAWLDTAERPVVLAGGGARGAAGELRSLAERLGAPVITTTNGKGVLPEDHPLALGAGVHLPSVRALVADADVVLVVGSELAPADLWYGPLPLAGRLIRVDVDPVQIVTNASPDVALVGGATSALRGLLDRLGPGVAAPDAAVGRGARGGGRGGAGWPGAGGRSCARIPVPKALRTSGSSTQLPLRWAAKASLPPTAPWSATTARWRTCRRTPRARSSIPPATGRSGTGCRPRSAPRSPAPTRR